MTTSTLDTTSPASGAVKRCFSWVTAKVPPHEMTAGERKLKKALFATVLVPTALIVLLMGELNYYSNALAKANAAAAAAAQTATSHQLQVLQQAARKAVGEPVPLCWVARCDRLK